MAPFWVDCVLSSLFLHLSHASGLPITSAHPPQAVCELYLGLYAGLAGVVLDPMEGFRLPGERETPQGRGG